MECDNQAISLTLLHNFLLCFEVLHKKIVASIVHPCNTATKTFQPNGLEEDLDTPAIVRMATKIGPK